MTEPTITGGMSRRLERALAEEWCNGCGKPAKEWGPVCGGMWQGDWTHYHSPEYWQQRLLSQAFICSPDDIDESGGLRG